MKPTNHYVLVWEKILCGWLDWPAEDFDRFVEGYRESLNETGDPLFYHEGELYYVYNYLIPPMLADRLSRSREHKEYYNDLAYFVRECLYPAIYGGPPYPPFDETFDWNQAKHRYQSMLHRYGFDLPVHGSNPA